MGPTHYQNFWRLVATAAGAPLPQIVEVGEWVLRQVMSQKTPQQMVESAKGDAWKGRMLAVMLLGASPLPEGAHDEVVQMASYLHHGKKTFHISPGLTQMLASSDVSSQFRYLKLPYESVYFSVGHTFAYLTGSDKLGRTWSGEPVTGIYVSRIMSLHLETHELRPVLGILACSDPMANAGAAYARFHIDEGRLAQVADEPMSMSALNGLVKQTSAPQERDAVLDAILAFTASVLCYLNSDSPDISPPHVHGPNPSPAELAAIRNPSRRRHLEREMQKAREEGVEHYDIGNTIKIVKEAQAERPSEPGKIGWHLSYRFTVRGHFRNQICGPGRTSHKLMWIRPFVKGPDKATLIHKQYEVGSGKAKRDLLPQV